MARLTIEIDVPDGWSVDAISLDGMEHLEFAGEYYRARAAVMLRRVHVWPEAVLQFAQEFDTPWMVVDPTGDAFLCRNDPRFGNGWNLGDRKEYCKVPREWAPPHDRTGKGWMKCKWRLPV